MSKSDTWQQQKYYNLRDRSVVKSSYRQAGESKYGPDHCAARAAADKDKQRMARENKAWQRNMTGLAMVAGIFLLYMLLVRKVPYCDKQKHSEYLANFAEGQASCGYHDEGLSLFHLSQTCKPCPKNAECDGTQMVSFNQFSLLEKSGQLLLTPEFIKKRHLINCIEMQNWI